MAAVGARGSAWREAGRGWAVDEGARGGRALKGGGHYRGHARVGPQTDSPKNQRPQPHRPPPPCVVAASARVTDGAPGRSTSAWQRGRLRGASPTGSTLHAAS